MLQLLRHLLGFLGYMPLDIGQIYESCCSTKILYFPQGALSLKQS